MNIGFSQNKSRLTVIKPRNKALFLSNSSTLPEKRKIIPESVDVIEQIISEPTTEIELKNEHRLEEKLAEIVSPKYSESYSKIIQIGLLNLNEIDNFGDLIRKYELPSWQFTAFDPQTGGAWIACSYEINQDKQNEFLKLLSKHLISFGVSPDQINFELCYDSIIAKKLGQVETSKTEQNLQPFFSGHVTRQKSESVHCSQLNRFHRLLEENFYHSTRVRKVSKLLEKAESFLVQYNYKKNYKAPLELPPNQLLCRQFGNDIGPEILKFKPLVLMGDKAGRARYLIGLKMIAGLFNSMAGSILLGKKRLGRIRKTKSAKKVSTVNAKLSKPLMPDVRNESKPLTIQIAKSADNNFEYISLKNMKWEKPEEKQAETVVKIGQVRNRQELINHAKDLLAQKRSIAELKKTLRMTEGELSMLRENMTFNNIERN